VGAGLLQHLILGALDLERTIETVITAAYELHLVSPLGCSELRSGAR
jgi:hypothetical protein